MANEPIMSSEVVTPTRAAGQGFRCKPAKAESQQSKTAGKMCKNHCGFIVL